MESNKEINNKENLSSKLNFPLSLNNKENQIFYENLKKYEEEKNEPLLSYSTKDMKPKENNLYISINNINNVISSPENINNNDIAINNYQKKEENIPKDNLTKITIEKEETLSNDLNLDELKLKVDYDKIESELNKLRNYNSEENEIKGDSNSRNLNINNKDNKNNQKMSLYSNSQIEGDLYYYSDEEDEKIKQIKYNNEKIKLLQENINKIDNNDNDNKIFFEQKENTYFNNDNIKNNEIINMTAKFENRNMNLNDTNKKLFENIEYGIDETGNPLSIKLYNEEFSNNKNNTEKIKKLIAYIIPSEEKGNNYLVNLKGEIVPKREDGDFDYKSDNLHIIIKNFDVQNPKLRVFGARQRYSSIVSDEENLETINQKKGEELENKILFLFNKINKIKDNLNYQSERNNNIKKTPFEFENNSNNNHYQKYNENIKKNELFNIWLKKYNPLTEKRNIYYYNGNKNDIIYQKIPLKRMNNRQIFNLLQNKKINNIQQNSNSNILNESNIKNTTEYNQNLIEKFKNNSYLRNIFYEKKNLGKIAYRTNRTPSPINKECIPHPQEIKNNNNTSRVNVYKIQRLKKGAGGEFKNYKEIFKLNLENNNNKCFSHSETPLLKNSSISSFFSQNKSNNSYIRKTNPILNYSDRLLQRDIYPSFFSNNNLNNNNNINSNISNHGNRKIPFLKKSLSTNNTQLTFTLNNIAKNIKEIENNIKITLQKIYSKNKDYNNKTNNIKNRILSYSSKHNKNSISTDNCKIYNLNSNKNKILKYKSNKNFNNERKINLRKIPLNKKFKISKSSSPIKDFQCSVLSDEANKMIEDFTNKSNTQRNITDNRIKKINIYYFMNNNNENKNKNKSIINKNKNKNNNSNNSFTKIKLNKSFNIENKKDKKNNLLSKLVKKIKNENYNKKLNINKMNRNNTSLNKIFEKNKNKKNDNKKNNNNKNSDKIIPIQNNLNINFYSKQKKPKIKNRVLISNNLDFIKRNIKKDANKNKVSSQSTSINSLKEIPLSDK